MAKKCAFCPNEAVEKGGEHLWDAWLNKALPPMKYRATRQYDLSSPKIQFDSDSLTEKLPVVCTQCNNGWMSVLTERIQSVFRRAILDGEPFSLSARDAALLGSFALMKAIVTNHAIKYDSFFSRAARERLRNDLAIPLGVKMWFASFRGESRMSTKNNFSIISQREAGGPLDGIEFLSHTYAVGHLVLQLLAPRWKDIRNSGKPLHSLTPNDYWSPATTLFWPHRGDLVSWPPSRYLSDDVIQSFIHRFTQPVTVYV